MVEEVVVGQVDEELAGGRIDHSGTGHGEGAALVEQAVVGFVLDRCTGLLLLHAGAEAAGLHHEARDHAVEQGAVVVAAVDVLEEVLHADRRLGRIEFYLDLAEAGGDQDVRLGGRRGGQQGTGEERVGPSAWRGGSPPPPPGGRRRSARNRPASAIPACSRDPR